MFDFQKKDQYVFGVISPKDDRDIDIQRLKTEARQGLWFESLRLVRDILLIISVFVLFGVFIAQPVVVEGTSMLPELHDGERLLVNKLIYYKMDGVDWGHISRGDVVVFWYPKDPDKSYVKRVIGLPGETVELRNGVAFINGQQLDEPYLQEEFNHSYQSFSPHKVEDHHFFVMGDNRDNSDDSRYWGSVPEKYIYGKAFFRYWKPSNAGFLHKGDAEIESENDKGVSAQDSDER